MSAAIALQLGQQAQVGAVERDGSVIHCAIVVNHAMNRAPEPPMRRNNASLLRGPALQSKAVPIPGDRHERQPAPRRTPAHRQGLRAGLHHRPWSSSPGTSYSADDHDVWAQLYERQRERAGRPRQRRVPRGAGRDGHDPARDPEVRRPQRGAARGHRLGADRRGGAAAGAGFLRPPGQPPLPGDLVDPHARTRSTTSPSRTCSTTCSATCRC